MAQLNDLYGGLPAPSINNQSRKKNTSSLSSVFRLTKFRRTKASRGTRSTIGTSLARAVAKAVRNGWESTAFRSSTAAVSNPSPARSEGLVLKKPPINIYI